jgi:flagellum-specific peptidoglycan hydrolase FlgJ
MALFPPDVIKWAQEAQKMTNCPASVSLAQWALESGYGTHTMNANNPFGIKWVPSCSYPFVTHVTTEQLANGKRIVITSKFVKFPDFQSAFNYHGYMLMNPHGLYTTAIPYAHDPVEFIRRISYPIAVEGHRYATDHEYFQKITSIMSHNNLAQYDGAQ